MGRSSRKAQEEVRVKPKLLRVKATSADPPWTDLYVVRMRNHLKIEMVDWKGLTLTVGMTEPEVVKLRDHLTRFIEGREE